MHPISDGEHPDPVWKSLYLAGGAAAVLAGIILRRNLGVEIALFHPVKPPVAAGDWFDLLQANRLLGLAYLGIFDALNGLLVGLMLAALYAALRRLAPVRSALGIGLGLLGIAVYIASNTALSLLSLSNQYAAAASSAQRTLLLAAGQALLSLNRFSSPGAQPGSGGYMSLLLAAAAGLIFSTALLRSKTFHRFTAYAGIAANGLDLMYCLAFPFASASFTELLGVLFIPAAGLIMMIWHILIGWGLLKLWRQTTHIYEETRSVLVLIKPQPERVR